jgi:hypothetical protein
MIAHKGRSYEEMPAAVPDGMPGAVGVGCRLPEGRHCPTAGMCYGEGIITCFYARPAADRATPAPCDGFGGCGHESGAECWAASGITLPTSSADRKAIPMVRGCLDYFPAALAAVAEVSRVGNEQHNPGEEMHHARGKSTDHADCIVRHLMDRGSLDADGQRHMAKVAWRALALLQEELEAAGAPLARGARVE